MQDIAAQERRKTHNRQIGKLIKEVVGGVLIRSERAVHVPLTPANCRALLEYREELAEFGHITDDGQKFVLRLDDANFLHCVLNLVN